MNPRAATFRDELGAVLRSTYAGTLCWAPRKPSALAAVDEGGGKETILRCGKCSGCREFDRRRLCDRLIAHFKSFEGELWAVYLECELSSAERFAHQVRRASAGSFLDGFVRVGCNAIALIAWGNRPRLRVPSWARSRRLCVERIKRSRGRRGWQKISAGMLIERAHYGAWTKRFYIRGLPPAERERWLVTRRGGIVKRHGQQAIGARAYAGGVGLYAPEAWRPPVISRHHKRESLRLDGVNPEPATIADLLAKLFEGAAGARSSLQGGAAEPRSSSMPGISARGAAGEGRLRLRTDGEGQAVGEEHAPRSDLPKENTGILSRRRYRGSEPDWAAWAAKMVEKAKARERGG